MARPLSAKFFNRHAATVARELLGCVLCVRRGSRVTRVPITETEAYIGPHDLASHASRGRTARTEVMFAPAGTIYVYLIYGMYEMLNIVTGKKDYPAAVLIRGIEGYPGPGKLTNALKIRRTLNGKLLGPKTGVWIEYGTQVSCRNISRTPRIGVAYAGDWAEKHLRFVLSRSSSEKVHT